MSLWREEKFLRLLSPQLERFHEKGAHTFAFRCPLCGDSQQNKTKTRGYVYAKNTNLMFKCHNCGVAQPFTAILKRVSRRLYDEFVMERLSEGRVDREPVRPVGQFHLHAPEKPVRPVVGVPLSACSTPENPLYPVYAYAQSRRLPQSAMTRLFATNEMRAWIRPLLAKFAVTAEELAEADAKAKRVADGVLYLVIPLRLQNGDWYGCQARALDKKDYITFRWAHAPLKVFGLEDWTPTKLTYVLEGPLDTLFIPNSIANCGSDLLTGMRALEDTDIFKSSTRRVYVWDAEPKNKEIVRHIRTAVKLHNSVVIWPKGFPKDVNDAVKLGMDAAQILEVMKKRTFTGLMAELEFEQWQK